MTRDETKRIVMLIASSYPNWNIKDPSATVDAWTFVLDDYKFPHVAAAVKAYILSDTSGFAPSIGQIVDRIEKGRPDIPEDLEAWALVSSAISHSGYEWRDEYEKLPEICQRAVGAPHNLHDWSQMQKETVQSVVQSQFLRSYRALRSREEEYSKYPTALKKALGYQKRDTDVPERQLPKPAARPEIERASEEYVDSLMKKYGFRK